MEALKAQLNEILCREGAEKWGVADFSALLPYGFPRGVSVAVSLPRHMVEELKEGPTREYYYLYKELNARLDRIITAGARFLEERGYESRAITSDHTQFIDPYRSVLPHKTAARLAGLGRIGKSGLLITPEYGAAVRLSTLLTKAPLTPDKPLEGEVCGDCRLCAEICPAGALHGESWREGKERDEILDAPTCFACQKEQMMSRFGLDSDLCGRCFALCPHTRRSASAPILRSRARQ